MKKTLKIIFLLVTVITLCSWGEKAVELLDSRKLIDLEKAIEISTPGGAAIFEDDQNDTDTEQNGSQNPSSKILVVTIRDEQITYNQKSVSGVEELAKKVSMDLKEGMKISLVDDYAEAHVYRDVLKALKEIRSEQNFDLSLE
ncbi:MAG: hypothetical protein IJL67_06610 [Oscillospiraceae bacterium]|nr:hypothetical protein [Oscillospiraceae bacterium]